MARPRRPVLRRAKVVGSGTGFIDKVAMEPENWVNWSTDPKLVGPSLKKKDTLEPGSSPLETING
jgi:hypothetical protein